MSMIKRFCCLRQLAGHVCYQGVRHCTTRARREETGNSAKKGPARLMSSHSELRHYFPICRPIQTLGGMCFSARFSPTADSGSGLLRMGRPALAAFPQSRQLSPTNQPGPPSFSYMFSSERMKSFDRTTRERRLRSPWRTLGLSHQRWRRRAELQLRRRPRAAGKRFEATKFEISAQGYLLLGSNSGAA